MTARVYYYPEPGAGLVTIDLGHGLSAAQVDSEPLGQVAETRSGRVWQSSRGGRESVALSLQGITDKDVEARLRTLERAVESGAVFGVSADHAKTWGGYAVGAVERGVTTIRLSSPLSYAAWSASGTVAAGDYVVIESGWPHNDSEKIRVASVSGTLLTLAWATQRTHPGRPLVRWSLFWPHLAARPGRMLTDVVPGVVWDWSIDARQAVQASTGGRQLGEALGGPGIGARNDLPPGKGSPWQLQISPPGTLAEPTTTTRAPLGGRLGGGGKG